MVMYFPQDTDVAKGPTAVMAGSQHLNQRPEGICTEVPIAGAGGSFVLIHYDIWHRKMENQTDLNRYMLKFEFTRLAPPTRAKTSRQPWQQPTNPPPLDLSVVWQATWDWLCGRPGNCAGGRAHAQELDSNDEATGISAGYRLAAAGQRRALLDALDSNAEPHENKRRYSDNGRIWQEDAAVRNAAHGLVQLGCGAVPGLIDVATSGTPRGRKHAAFALGEIGSAAAVPTLIEALGDEDVHVRIAAAEAMGIIAPSIESRDALLAAMHDSASEVRFDAALSLVRAAAQSSAELMAPTVAPLDEALYDTNRYVSAYAAEALERIGSAEALEALLPFLRTARWCPHTDNQRPF